MAQVAPRRPLSVYAGMARLPRPEDACSSPAHGMIAQHRRDGQGDLIWKTKRFERRWIATGLPPMRTTSRGAPDLPRGRGARISAIGRAYPRAAEHSVVSRRAAEPETLHSAADNRRGRPLGH